MRRIDVISIGSLVLLAGAALFLVFRLIGFDTTDAGIWSQAIFVVLLMGWVATYVFRAVTGTMTYNQQLDDYEDAVLEKRLQEMSAEELAALESSLEQTTSTAESASETTS